MPFTFVWDSPSTRCCSRRSNPKMLQLWPSSRANHKQLMLVMLMARWWLLQLLISRGMLCSFPFPLPSSSSFVDFTCTQWRILLRFAHKINNLRTKDTVHSSFRCLFVCFSSSSASCFLLLFICMVVYFSTSAAVSCFLRAVACVIFITHLTAALVSRQQFSVLAQRPYMYVTACYLKHLLPFPLLIFNSFAKLVIAQL